VSASAARASLQRKQSKMPNAALVYPDTKLFIDGEWREGRECRTIPVIDPATEETIGSVAHTARRISTPRWPPPIAASNSEAQPRRLIGLS